MRRLLLLFPICLIIASDQLSTVLPPPVRRPLAASPTEAPLPTAAQFAELAKTEPIECVRASLRKYRKEVHGLHGLMQKQERLAGKLNPPETIEFWYNDDPHKVFLAWRSKPSGQADRVLYVDGANDNQMFCHPASAIARAVVGNVVGRDPESKEAKAGGRVSVGEFGLRKAAERQLGACEEAKKAGHLHLEYLGLKEIPEVNNRPHHMFLRLNELPEGPEKIRKVEFGLDAETWMQTVSHVYNGNEELLGAYFFKDIEINPKFAEGQFEKSQLLK
ncbi:MAG: DUF1571 domain-containing protein [Gemmataceae bacterium]